MPFCETYLTAFKNDIEYSQLVLHTTAILQNHKFIQVNTRCASEMNKASWKEQTFKHADCLRLCVFSLCLPERTSWTNYERRLRSSGKGSKRRWWVDWHSGCREGHTRNLKWFCLIGLRMCLKFLSLVLHALSSISQSNVICAMLYTPKNVKVNNSQNWKTDQNTHT